MELELEYCPTELMWIDMHTKPKQGTPFRFNRSRLMNIPVEYDDEEKRKNTNPILLLSEEEKPFIPYINPYLEAKYAGIKNLNHRGSVLRDSTNCPLIQASKAKVRATPGGATSLSTQTPKRAKTITWADVARGNSVSKPTRHIKARSARARPPMNHGGNQCR